MSLQTMELLTHVNRRLEALPDLKLPLVALLEVLSSPETAPLTRNVTLTYLDQAFMRAPAVQQFEQVGNVSQVLQTGLEQACLCCHVSPILKRGICGR